MEFGRQTQTRITLFVVVLSVLCEVVYGRTLGNCSDEGGDFSCDWSGYVIDLILTVILPCAVVGLVLGMIGCGITCWLCVKGNGKTAPMSKKFIKRFLAAIILAGTLAITGGLMALIAYILLYSEYNKIEDHLRQALINIKQLVIAIFDYVATGVRLTIQATNTGGTDYEVTTINAIENSKNQAIGVFNDFNNYLDIINGLVIAFITISIIVIVVVAILGITVVVLFLLKKTRDMMAHHYRVAAGFVSLISVCCTLTFVMFGINLLVLFVFDDACPDIEAALQESRGSTFHQVCNGDLAGTRSELYTQVDQLESRICTSMQTSCNNGLYTCTSTDCAALINGTNTTVSVTQAQGGCPGGCNLYGCATDCTITETQAAAQSDTAALLSLQIYRYAITDLAYLWDCQWIKAFFTFFTGKCDEVRTWILIATVGILLIAIGIIASIAAIVYYFIEMSFRTKAVPEDEFVEGTVLGKEPDASDPYNDLQGTSPGKTPENTPADVGDDPQVSIDESMAGGTFNWPSGGEPNPVNTPASGFV